LARSERFEPQPSDPKNGATLNETERWTNSSANNQPARIFLPSQSNQLRVGMVTKWRQLKERWPERQAPNPMKGNQAFRTNGTIPPLLLSFTNQKKTMSVTTEKANFAGL